ncbi:ABC transporter permease [Mesorhizobium sp. 1B3]|uniref:ABC transporter permease n=1 Tax=Mesorhizobium sp. 1B3 TaxID=3243599 RepID=UPI003D96949F
MHGNRTLKLIGFCLLQAVPILIAATLLVFLLMHLVPGDIAITLAGETATRERIEEIRQLYGLDRSALMQYWIWLSNILRGDFSNSLLSNVPVLDSILARLPVSLTLVGIAMFISLAFGIPIGIFAASRPGSTVDSLVTNIASVGIALPGFWLGMILVTWLAMNLQLFPVSGMTHPSDSFWRAVYDATLPAVALGASGIAEVARQTRSALIEFQSSQHMRTLVAKGLTHTSIFWKHGLKNISVTLLTVVGLLFNRLLGGTVVIEAVFAINGMGSLVVAAASGKDFPVMQGVMLTMVLIVVLVNLVIEILYSLLDPRTS